VDDQRPHRGNATLGDNAIDRLNPRRQIVNAVIAEHTQIVRSGENAQWTILSSGIVKTHAQGKDRVESGSRSVRVLDAFL